MKYCATLAVVLAAGLLASACSGGEESAGGDADGGDAGDGDGDVAGTGGGSPTGSGGDGIVLGAGGTATGGGSTSGGAPSTGGESSVGGGDFGTGGGDIGTGGAVNVDCSAQEGADPTMSFFVTSYNQLIDLAGSEDGFGGDLRYNGAATGLEGADAICQKLADNVCFGHKIWHAYLSTSTVNAKDRVGAGPWYDFSGNLVASNVAGLTSGNRPAGGACNTGTFDELGTFHDGKIDVNGDTVVSDDDHDTMTATLQNGTYAGFSCDDWTSTTAVDPNAGQQGGGPGQSGGLQMGHSWPANSGQGWSEAHAGHACEAGTNFVQDGPGDPTTVGGGGGYGGFYCFAL